MKHFYEELNSYSCNSLKIYEYTENNMHLGNELCGQRNPKNNIYKQFKVGINSFHAWPKRFWRISTRNKKISVVNTIGYNITKSNK